MECLKNVASEANDKDSHKTDPMSAYHRHVVSTILPGVEQEYTRMQSKNKHLEKENEVLKKKVESLMTDAEQLKTKHQRVNSVILERDHLKSQLMNCKNELLVLGKKIRIQQTDLRREHKQTEDLKQEVQSVKKELQSVKKQAINQRTQQQQLKEYLEQVVKDRDDLNDKWLQCQTECSELGEKINSQQSSLNKKDCQCKEQVRQIHLLKQEKQKLEKVRGFLENEADSQKRALKRCEEELQLQKEKFRESEACRNTRIVIIKQKPQAVRKSSQDVPLQKIEALQKELLAQTEELRRTQKLCEELKQKLTKMSVQFLQCKVTLRGRKEKLQAVTAQRNMYKSETEKMQKLLAAAKKPRLGEKLCHWASKKKKDMKLSSVVKSKQYHCPPPSPKQSHLPTTCSQVESKLMIIGTRI